MREWNDLSLLNKLDDKYRTIGKTGAEAVATAWCDIADGKIKLIQEEFDVARELGLVHAINTWSKHLMIENKIHTRRED
jgi:hypothetical protein